MSFAATVPCGARRGFIAAKRWHLRQLRAYTAGKVDENQLGADVSHNSPLQSRKEIDDFLARPSWGVSSLLPLHNLIDNTVTRRTLRKLLKLSALPPPSSAQQEEKMLKDLRSQVHFVRQMQKVDTSGVEPLVAIRDETPEATKEAEYNLENMAEEFNKEEVVGKYYKRIRRRKDLPASQETVIAEDWDVLGNAKNKEGRFFKVKSSETVES